METEIKTKKHHNGTETAGTTAIQSAALESMPNLHEAKEAAIDFSSEYWTPENVGEYKLGIAMSIEDSIYEDQETGEEIALPCVIFIEQTPDGELRVIRNGSKRLVATIENAAKTGQIQLGRTPIKIIFKGKMKNSTNNFRSDRWSVKPLIING